MSPTWLQVTSGEGPAECERAVRFVVDELAREAVKAGVTVTVLDVVPGDKKDSLQSALVAIEGDAAEAFLSGWVGTVLWKCRSPYRPTHRRKNWFVGVAKLTAPNERAWTPGEVTVETMRASGPGGQHVNKTESAVRVTHAPTGLVAVAREERSQHRNKALALARLAEMIAGLNAAARRTATAARREMHRELVRGDPIRTYTGPDFRRSAE